MGLEYGGVKMAGYFFVTGMTVIEFPDGIQWNKRAKPTFTGACAGLFPVMIDNFPAPPDMPIWSEHLSPNECYFFMCGVPFDFILGGGVRPQRPTAATYSFSFLSPDGKQVVTLTDCLWNEKVKPEEGGEAVSARSLAEQGYKQLSGPTFEYDAGQRQWRGIGDWFVRNKKKEIQGRVSHGREKGSIALSHGSGER